MKKLVVILTAILFVACTSRNVSTREVDKLIANQLENNKEEIQQIVEQLKDLGIEKREKNIALLAKLRERNEAILKLNDLIDLVDNDTAYRIVADYISKNLNDTFFSSRIPLQISQDTPAPLLKLYLATQEHFFIQYCQGKYDYGEDLFSTEQLKVEIIPSKTVIRNGEKISGQIAIVATTKFENPQKAIKRITLNGMEIKVSESGWNFEITPIVKEKGLVTYELNTEIVVGVDSKIFKGKELIYIQN